MSTDFKCAGVNNMARLNLSDDLTVTFETKSNGLERDYIFYVEEKSTGKHGFQTIHIDEFEHVDFKNQMFIEAAAKNSVNAFWDSYKSISDLDTLGEGASLLPFVLARFGIKYDGSNNR